MKSPCPCTCQEELQSKQCTHSVWQERHNEGYENKPGTINTLVFNDNINSMQ